VWVTGSLIRLGELGDKIVAGKCASRSEQDVVG
jgi:hypothetical protein